MPDQLATGFNTSMDNEYQDPVSIMVGTPSYFVYACQKCQAGDCRLTLQPCPSAIDFVGDAGVESWLYDFVFHARISHTSLVVALYYLDIVLRSLDDESSQATSPQHLRQAVDAQVGNPLRPIRDQFSTSRTQNCTRSKPIITVHCPHCIFIGCVLVAAEIFEAAPSPTWLLNIASAGDVSATCVHDSANFAVSRIGTHLNISLPTIDMLFRAYEADPVRQMWWARDDGTQENVIGHGLAMRAG